MKRTLSLIIGIGLGIFLGGYLLMYVLLTGLAKGTDEATAQLLEEATTSTTEAWTPVPVPAAPWSTDTTEGDPFGPPPHAERLRIWKARCGGLKAKAEHLEQTTPDWEDPRLEAHQEATDAAWSAFQACEDALPFSTADLP